MLVRSYSRHSRVIWCDATAETSGQSSRTSTEHRQLVGGVDIRVEQADRDRLDAVGAEVRDDRVRPSSSSGCRSRALWVMRPGSSRLR